MPHPTVSEMLTAYRDRTGASFQAIADALGVTRGFAQNLVNGNRIPRRPEDINALAALLGVDTDTVWVAANTIPPDLAQRLSVDLDAVRTVRAALNQPIPD